MQFYGISSVWDILKRLFGQKEEILQSIHQVENEKIKYTLQGDEK